MELKKEKIIALMLLSKELITDSYISISDLISNELWDNLKDCLLRKKGLLPEQPEINFSYLPYALNDIDDNENYTIRIIFRVLRNKSRGRRSNQFYLAQLQGLTDYREIYIDNLKLLIANSGIDSATVAQSQSNSSSINSK